MTKELTIKKERIITILREEFEHDELVEQFERASLEFEIMIKQGLATKRGNNLLTALEIKPKKILFNV